LYEWQGRVGIGKNEFQPCKTRVIRTGDLRPMMPNSFCVANIQSPPGSKIILNLSIWLTN